MLGEASQGQERLTNQAQKRNKEEIWRSVLAQMEWKQQM